MKTSRSPDVAYRDFHSASPLPDMRPRPGRTASCATTSAPAAAATAAVRSVERESTTTISSTSGIRSTRSVRMAATIAPTVASSSRAGSTTLIPVSPLASSRRRGGQSPAVLVRRANHDATSGSTRSPSPLAVPDGTPPH